jgi:putative ABC transport system permease protein
MLKNHLKTALRFLQKNKGFSLINVFGLAVGMACCLLVSRFITDELSYDRQNKDADRIYRIVEDQVNDDGGRTPEATTPPALAVALQKDIPDVEKAVRLFPRGWDNNFYVRCGDKKFVEENICRADSTLFDVFTVPFLRGDPKQAMTNPNAIILTTSMARKYFGTADPMGKTIFIDDWKPRAVTAVIKDFPDNAHFKIDLLVTIGSDPMGLEDDNWGWNSFYTYIKLKPGSDIARVDEKIRALYKRNQPERKTYLHSQALTDIHLDSHLKSELRPNSDRSYLYVFGTIAFLILLIACVNYINLTTAQSSLRAKEIGIRKISGALKRALIGQFLTEAVLLSLAAAGVAIGLAFLLLPALNTITGKELVLFPPGNYVLLTAVLGFALAIGLLAGFYPAWYLSSFEPVRILKGENQIGVRGLPLRKILVVAQFTISITLIAGTIVIIRQMDFIRETRLGLDPAQVIVVNDVGFLDSATRTPLKNDLLRIPGVSKVAATDGVPVGQTWAKNIRKKGGRVKPLVNFLSVDEDFIGALDIQLKEGRDFYPNRPFDSTEVMLNEKAVKELALTAPVIGQQIVWNENTQTGVQSFATVVGVLRDFHFSSVKTEIKPFAFVTVGKRQWKYVIRMNGADVPRTVAAIKAVWDRHVTTRPFQFTFLDESYAKLYAAEMNFKRIFTYITAVALFISCLGLFALSAFTSDQRSKEVGIRKVLGATVSDIAALLCKDLVRLVLVASAISFPIAWWVMNSWLRNFAYKINMGWWVFVLAGSVALFMALLTIGFHIIRAAGANPIKSLRTA